MHLLNVGQNHGKAQPQEGTGRMAAESCVELSKLIMEAVEFDHATGLPSLASVSPQPRSGVAALLSANRAIWLNPNQRPRCEPTSVLNSNTFSVAAFFFLTVLFFFLITNITNVYFLENALKSKEENKSFPSFLLS